MPDRLCVLLAAMLLAPGERPPAEAVQALGPFYRKLSKGFLVPRVISVSKTAHRPFCLSTQHLSEMGDTEETSWF